MAAALPADGRVTTLEVDEDIAAGARRHIDASPSGHRVELIVGDALETIAGLNGPFDLVCIDSWKADYPAHYDALNPKLAEHGVTVADNPFRDGAALDPKAQDEGTDRIRKLARQVHQDERVHNVLLTIGDGVMPAWRPPGGRAVALSLERSVPQQPRGNVARGQPLALVRPGQDVRRGKVIE
jgi:predicted O-methyltransferase YrrM